MKQLTATEARKQFFKLLDLAVEGEPVLIERKGIPLRLVREKGASKKKKKNYKTLIRSSVDHADNWSWEWDASSGLKIKE